MRTAAAAMAANSKERIKSIGFPLAKGEYLQQVVARASACEITGERP